MTDERKVREAFEAWMSKECPDASLSRVGAAGSFRYVETFTAATWIAWQAALAWKGTAEECSVDDHVAGGGKLVGEDAKDAARYRWLRTRVGVDFIFGEISAYLPSGNGRVRPETTDKAIDQALAAGRKTSHEGG